MANEVYTSIQLKSISYFDGTIKDQNTVSGCLSC